MQLAQIVLWRREELIPANDAVVGGGFGGVGVKRELGVVVGLDEIRASILFWLFNWRN